MKLAMLLTLALAVPLTTGCATVKPLALSTAECSAGKIVQALPSAVSSVEQVLAAPNADTQAQLTQLAIAAGIEVINCAVAAVVAQLEAGHTSTSAGAALAEHQVPPSVQLLRAYAWQSAHPVLIAGK